MYINIYRNYRINLPKEGSGTSLVCVGGDGVGRDGVGGGGA